MNFSKYHSEIQYCREKFTDQLVIKAGIKICESHLLKEKYQETLNLLELDFFRICPHYS